MILKGAVTGDEDRFSRFHRLAALGQWLKYPGLVHCVHRPGLQVSAGDRAQS